LIDGSSVSTISLVEAGAADEFVRALSPLSSLTSSPLPAVPLQQPANRAIRSMAADKIAVVSSFFFLSSTKI
jgi:hypothetical protein